MFPIFSGFYIPKITIIGSFLTELLKIKMSSLFFKQEVGHTALRPIMP